MPTNHDNRWTALTRMLAAIGALAIALLSVACNRERTASESCLDGKGSNEKRWRACRDACDGDDDAACKKAKKLAVELCEEDEDKAACRAACKEDDEYCKDDPPKPSNAASVAPAAAPVVAAPTHVELAYSTGRNYGFSCVFMLLGSTDDAVKNHREAGQTAAALGVTLPPLSSKGTAIKDLRSGELYRTLKTKYDLKVAAAVELGKTLDDIMLGVGLKSDISSDLRGVELAAKVCEVPSAVWQSKLEALRSNATDQNVKALGDAFDAHFRFKG
jgi:hypothetical protein